MTDKTTNKCILQVSIQESDPESFQSFVAGTIYCSGNNDPFLPKLHSIHIELVGKELVCIQQSNWRKPKTEEKILLHMDVPILESNVTSLGRSKERQKKKKLQRRTKTMTQPRWQYDHPTSPHFTVTFPNHLNGTPNSDSTGATATTTTNSRTSPQEDVSSILSRLPENVQLEDDESTTGHLSVSSWISHEISVSSGISYRTANTSILELKAKKRSLELSNFVYKRCSTPTTPRITQRSVSSDVSGASKACLSSKNSMDGSGITYTSRFGCNVIEFSCTGQYEFPFQLNLPSGLPPTMSLEMGDGISKCHVQYEIRAYIVVSSDDDQGERRRHMTSQPRTVKITGRQADPSSRHTTTSESNATSRQRSRPSPSISEYISIPSSCLYGCWLNARGDTPGRGSMTLTCALNKRDLIPNEEAVLSIFLENDSNVVVKEMNLTLTESVQCTVDGKNESATPSIRNRMNLTNILLKKRIDCFWYQGSLYGSVKDLDQVGTSMFFREKLTIPTSTCSTYNGKLIQVKHQVRVDVATPWYMSDLSYIMDDISVTNNHSATYSSQKADPSLQSQELASIGVTRTSSSMSSASSMDDSHCLTIDEMKHSNASFQDKEGLSCECDWRPVKSDIIRIPKEAIVLSQN